MFKSGSPDSAILSMLYEVTLRSTGKTDVNAWATGLECNRKCAWVKSGFCAGYSLSWTAVVCFRVYLTAAGHLQSITIIPGVKAHRRPGPAGLTSTCPQTSERSSSQFRGDVWSACRFHEPSWLSRRELPVQVSSYRNFSRFWLAPNSRTGRKCLPS